MPTSCAAYNCRNRHTAGNGVSFFRFPLKNSKLLEKWTAAMKWDKWTPSQASRICSEHFEEKCFRYNNDKRSLHENAVPSIFKFPGHLAKKRESRLPPKARVPPAKKPHIPQDDVLLNDSPVPCVSSTIDHQYTILSPTKLKKMYESKKQRCSQLQSELKRVKKDAKRCKQRCCKLNQIIDGLKRKLAERSATSFENYFSDTVTELFTNRVHGFNMNSYPESVQTWL